MKLHPIHVVILSLLATIVGCSSTGEIAGGAAQTAGAATVGAADTAGQAGMQVLGNAGEATASVMRGAGEAATEATGGQTGVVKEVKKVADEIGKQRNVDFMGNDVVIDPSEDKKIRMTF